MRGFQNFVSCRLYSVKCALKKKNRSNQKFSNSTKRNVSITVIALTNKLVDKNNNLFMCLISLDSFFCFLHARDRRLGKAWPTYAV